MASFNTTGIEGLSLSLEEVADLPEDILQRMLTAQGEVIADAHRKEIRQRFHGGVGKLADSITVYKKMRSAGSGRGMIRYVLVYPQGIHGSYNRKAVTKTYARTKHGTTYTVGGDVKKVTNQDVAFVLEFGRGEKTGIRPIEATQWMRKANEASEGQAAQAAIAVYDEWLKSKGL